MSKIPSIAMIPSGYKANKVYSVLPTNGDGDLTLSRASTATRVNELGLIEDVATGTPRLDYSDGGCPSLLVEPQSTNLVTYSEDFSNASWVKLNATITSNTTTSPKGDLSASQLSFSDATARIYTSVSTTLQSQFSIYMKCDLADVGKTVRLREATGAQSIDVELKSTWSRYVLSFSDSNANVQIQRGQLGTPIDSLYIWGAQLEEQAYATSYIPTTGATATRVAETVSKTGLENYINSSEGVLYVEMSALENSVTSDVRMISLNDGGQNNELRIDFREDNVIQAVFTANGSPQAVISTQSYDIIKFNKIAFKYKQNDFALWINGIEVYVDLNGSTGVSNAFNTLDFSRGTNLFNMYAKIKDLRVYNVALSDSELSLLTS